MEEAAAGDCDNTDYMVAMAERDLEQAQGRICLS